jgi:transcriptional/translational regulatory protein YebC/TACO1
LNSIEEFEKQKEIQQADDNKITTEEEKNIIHDKLTVKPSYDDFEDEVNADKESEFNIILATETMAEICVTQGLHSEALKIYDRILSHNPNNKAIMQKRNELAKLLKLIDMQKKKEKVKQLSKIMEKL